MIQIICRQEKCRRLNFSQPEIAAERKPLWLDRARVLQGKIELLLRVGRPAKYEVASWFKADVELDATLGQAIGERVDRIPVRSARAGESELWDSHAADVRFRRDGRGRNDKIDSIAPRGLLRRFTRLHATRTLQRAIPDRREKGS